MTQPKRPQPTDLKSQLIADEGERFVLYPDTEGYLTIGIGRLLDPRKGGRISPDESALMFDNDRREKTVALQKALPWILKLDDARLGVLLNMAFQMGVGGVLGFVNTLQLIKIGSYGAAAEGMLNSKWAKQTPNRAERLAEQMRTGVWQ